MSHNRPLGTSRMRLTGWLVSTAHRLTARSRHEPTAHCAIPGCAARPRRDGALHHPFMRRLLYALCLWAWCMPVLAGDTDQHTCANAHYHHHGPHTACHSHLRADDPHRMQPQPPPKQGPDPYRSGRVEKVRPGPTPPARPVSEPDPPAPVPAEPTPELPSAPQSLGDEEEEEPERVCNYYDFNPMTCPRKREDYSMDYNRDQIHRGPEGSNFGDRVRRCKAAHPTWRTQQCMSLVQQGVY